LSVVLYFFICFKTKLGMDVVDILAAKIHLGHDDVILLIVLVQEPPVASPRLSPKVPVTVGADTNPFLG
jgi:hypothetical protein